MNDEHGDRMKSYEYANEMRYDNDEFLYARLDGRKFSRLTKSLKKPFDDNFRRAMTDTTKYLIEQTNATIGYVQSDEISLVFSPSEHEHLFGGRQQKMASLLAASASVYFNHHSFITDHMEPSKMLPHFDCRVCALPSKTEVANMILWRWKDARKNAIQSIGHEAFGHEAMMNKDTLQKIEYISSRGVDITTFGNENLFGTFVKKKRTEKYLTEDELKSIPVQFQPNGPVKRSQIIEMWHMAFDKLPTSQRERFLYDEWS
jgi:tRNA(His) guanylyltransferase